MRALLQRVTEAHVDFEGETIAEIGPGLVVLLCAMRGDGDAEVEFLARKVAALRIFEDADGKMNRAVRDIGGSALVVSQFTLAAQWRKGNRPGFSDGADFETAERLWLGFADALAAEGVTVAKGRFRSHLAVHLVNDGPVTIWMDTADR